MLRIFKGFDNLDPNPSLFFDRNMACTGGHSLKVIKPRFCLDIRRFSCANRIVDIWNGLNENITTCDSINGLKIELINLCMVENAITKNSLKVAKDVP